MPRTKYRNPCSQNGAPLPLYQAWRNMLRRCYDKRYEGYKNYGKRGIEVCSLWRDNYDNFADFANEQGYRKGLTLVLINQDGDFRPGNAEFVPVEVVMGRRYDAAGGWGLRRQRKPVIDTRNRELYPSIRAAAAAVGGFEADLSRAVKNGKLYKKTYWIPADPDMDIDAQLAVFSEPVLATKTRGRPIHNITTDKMYPSVTEAARCAGVGTGSITASIKRGGSCHGQKWEYVTQEVHDLLK